MSGKKVSMGTPLQIVDIQMNANGKSKISFDKKTLKNILSQVGPDRDAYLISIAGPSRQGKSFLLSFLVKYFHSITQGKDSAWLQNPQSTDPIEGYFPFKNGIDRQTTGLWMWSNPFFLEQSDGKQIAVLLMDTQGVFDDHTTQREWSAIVGLSLLTSSCLIYNIMINLQEDALQILETFMQFGILAMESDDDQNTPFQKLLFLIRDWNMPDSCDYGEKGGKQFLKEKLEIKSHLPPESIRVRHTLKQCFEEIECFLLPDPGEPAKSNEFKGSLSELEPKFFRHLKTFVENIANPDEMHPKSLHGRRIPAMELLVQFEKYVKIFNSNVIPNPMTFMEATAHASCEAALIESLDWFNEEALKMLNSIGYCSDPVLKGHLEPLQNRALEIYSKKKKFGDDKIKTVCQKKLTIELRSAAENAVKENSAKKTLQFEIILKEMEALFRAAVEEQLQGSVVPPLQLDIFISNSQAYALENFERKRAQFGPEFSAEFEPMLNNFLSQAANQTRQGHLQRFREIEVHAMDMVENAFDNYVDGVEAQASSGFTIAKLQNLDIRQRERALRMFRRTLKIQHDELLNFFEGHLQAKMNEYLEGIAIQCRDEHERRDAEANQLVNTLVSQFSDELKAVIQQNPPPTQNAIELAYDRMRSQILEAFLNSCTIEDVRGQKPYREMLSRSMKEEFGKIEHALNQRHQDIDDKINAFGQAVQQEYKAAIDEELKKPKMLSHEELLDIHETRLKSLQSDLRFPDFVPSERNAPLLAKIKGAIEEDFKTILSDHHRKLQSAEQKVNQICAEEVMAYQEKMQAQCQGILRDEQVEKIHDGIRTQILASFQSKLQNLPNTLLSTYTRKLDAELIAAKSVHLKIVEGNLQEQMSRCDQALSEALLSYKSGMTKFSQGQGGEELMLDYHTFYKMQAVNHLTQIVSRMPNSKEYLDKLEEEINKFFQGRIDELRHTKLNLEKNAIEQQSEEILTVYRQDMKRLVNGEAESKKVLENFQLDLRDRLLAKFKKHAFSSDQELIKSYSDQLGEQMDQEFGRMLNVYEQNVSKIRGSIDDILDSVKQTYKMDMEKVGKDMVQEDLELFIRCHHQYLKAAVKTLSLKTSGQPISDYKREEYVDRLTADISNMFDEIKEKAFAKFEKYSGLIESVREHLDKEMQNGSPSEAGLRSLHSRAVDKAVEDLKRSTDFPNPNIQTQFLSNFRMDSQKILMTCLEAQKLLEPDPKALEMALDAIQKTYASEMKTGTFSSEFINPKVLKEHHRVATQICGKRLQAHGINLTAKVKKELDALLLSKFKPYEDDNLKKVPVKNPAIGIDLGTTFSCVSVYMNGELKIIPNENHKSTTPSYVAFKNGVELIGEPAKNQAHENPENTIFDAKRLIGRKFDDKTVQDDIRNWPFTVINEGGIPKIKIEDTTYHPEEISAKLLKKLKDDAERHLGCEVGSAVITVPAYFNDSQKQATKDAGKVAGFNVLGIVNEPTAAAIAYSLNYSDAKTRKVLIFDFGGGTFDVALLSIFRGDIKVEAVGGDTHLGGEDFDSRMVDHCIAEFSKQNPGVNLVADRDSTDEEIRRQVKRRMRRIRNECEKRKIDLSGAALATAALDAIHGILDLHVEFTRQKFEELTMDLMKKSIDVIAKVLSDAAVDKDQVDDIVLVGGSTRVPKIQELLQAFFGGKALSRRVNPDEVVAKGAAIHAAILNGNQAIELGHIKLSDVAPLSIGIEVSDGTLSVIIPKNSSVPLSKSKDFYTKRSDQTEVDITIFEGEQRMAEDNHLLGKFTMKGIPPVSTGTQKIQVTMTMNAEGILNVKAVCVANGQVCEITIDEEKDRLSSQDIENLRLN